MYSNFSIVRFLFRIFMLFILNSFLLVFFFRIFWLILLKSFWYHFLHCHVSTPFWYFFLALVFFLSLLYISVLFTSYIYIYLESFFYIILHGNVAMVAMVFKKVLLFEKVREIFSKKRKNHCHRCHIAMWLFWSVSQNFDLFMIFYFFDLKSQVSSLKYQIRLDTWDLKSFFKKNKNFSKSLKITPIWKL